MSKSIEDCKAWTGARCEEATSIPPVVGGKPPNATHWSVRSMAAVAGVSYSSVQRIWRAHGLKPHLVEAFKVSRDKNFAAKVEDVVGLYLNPPDSCEQGGGDRPTLLL